MDIKRLSSSKPAVIIILAVSFGVYFNALFNGFVVDDNYLILTNLWIKDIKYIPEILFGIHENLPNYYRPLTHIIFMIEYHIFGFNPWGFHLTNIILHTGVSVLVLLVTALLINKLQSPQLQSIKQCNATSAHTLPGTDNRTVPFIAALLFAVHPLHTESVAWVSGVQDLSFTFFYLLAFYFYLRSEGVWGKFFIVSLFFFFMATLCKEPALTLPIFLFAYDFSFKRYSILPLSIDTFFLLAKRYLPYLIVAGIYFILRTYAVEGVAPVKFHAELSNYEYFINVFPLFAQYLGKLILPINLNAAYILHPIHSLLEWEGIMGVSVTLCFILALYLVRDRNRVIFFSLLLVVIPLLPAFYIPAMGVHTFAERYLYLPSVGFVVVFSLGIFWVGRLDLLKGRAIGYLLLSAVLIIAGLYSAGTIKRNPIWKDDLTLWLDTVKKSPDSDLVHTNLAVAYYGQGRMDEALRELRFALQLNPSNAKAYYNLGNYYNRRGQIDKAIEEYKKAISHRPDSASAHNSLGIAYGRKGLFDMAIQEFEMALRLKPDYRAARLNLSHAYKQKRLMNEAIMESK
jgi:tetratricopeptide (TPR) repeat protein